MNNLNKKYFSYFKKLKQTSGLFALILFTFFAGFASSYGLLSENSKIICVHQVKASIPKPFIKSFTLLQNFDKSPINSIKKLSQGPANNHFLNELFLYFAEPVIACKDFSIIQCSYYFLRMNVLKSQSHPPTLF